MSLNRSKVVWKEPVDPYAVSDSDEEKKPVAKAVRKPAVRRRRPVSEVTSSGPRLGDDWLEVEEEVKMEVGGEEGVVLVKVNSELVGLGKGKTMVYTAKDDNNMKRAVTWKTTVNDVQKPVLRYLDLGEHQYQALRQPTSANTAYLVRRNNNIVTAVPTNVFYHAQPCVKTAADMLDIEEIEKKMRQKQMSLNIAVQGTALSATEEKIFVKNGSLLYGGAVSRNEFISLWEQVKGGASPPEAVVKILFRGGTGARLGVDEVLCKLSGMTGLEEAAAKAMQKQQREDDAEQDLVEQVDGTEKVFDDDAEDHPELDPDQSRMDVETKKWGQTAEEKSTPKTHLEELTEPEAKPADQTQEEEEDEEEEKKPPANPTTLPPPPPASTTTTTTKNLRKRAATSNPPTKRRTPLQVAIDTALHHTLSSVSKPMAAVKKQVVTSIPQYAELKAQAAKLEVQGKIADKAAHVRKEVSKWGPIIEARIREVGGSSDAAGNVVLK